MNDIDPCHQGQPWPVTFRITRQLREGEVLVVSGPDAVLGGSKVENAPVMTRKEGDIWSLDTKLIMGNSVEFKFVIINAITKKLEDQEAGTRKTLVSATPFKMFKWNYP